MNPTTNWVDVWIRNILGRGYGLHLRPAAGKGHWRVDLHQEGNGSVFHAYTDDWEEALLMAHEAVLETPAIGLPWSQK